MAAAAGRLLTARPFGRLRRSFGCVLYEMLMRETLWHGNTDSNIARAADYALLARWPDAVKRDRLDRVPSRWAQQLLGRLLARNPAARPPTMAHVLQHPFFRGASARAAPRLRGGDKDHMFLSHFQVPLPARRVPLMARCVPLRPALCSAALCCTPAAADG